MEWTNLTSSYAQTNTQSVREFNKTRRPIALYISGLDAGQTLQAVGRVAGSSDALEDINGMAYTADGVYSVDLADGLEIDWSVSGSGTIETVKLIR